MEKVMQLFTPKALPAPENGNGQAEPLPPPMRREIVLTRVGIEELSSQMGKSTRNAITGKIKLQGIQDFEDFCFVDLYARNSISGTVESLSQDPYLFRPVLLKYRTWLYHFDYTARVTAFERGEHSMLRQALDHVCIDAPVSAGRWSPLISFVPLSLCVALTGNFLVTMVPLIVFGLLHVATNATNTAKWYKWLRPATFVFRLALFGFMATLLVTDGELQGSGILGLILALLISLLDVLIGDGGILFALRLQCNYEITNVLPQRLFICERRGACDLDKLIGSRGCVSEVVSGFSPWGGSDTLIADIQGIIVELRPITVEEWKKVALLETSLRFLGLDIFDDQITCTRELLKKQSGNSVYQSEDM